MTVIGILKPGELNPLSSGFNGTSVADGTGVDGAVIDNTTNRYGYLAIFATWSYALAPTANKTVEIHLLKSLDGGTKYDEVSPSTLIGSISPPPDTGQHNKTIREFIPLSASKYKLHVKNVDTAQSITITLDAYGHNEKVEN